MFAHVFGSMSSSLTACDDKAIKLCALKSEALSSRRNLQIWFRVSFFVARKLEKNVRAWMDVIEAEKTLSNK